MMESWGLKEAAVFLRIHPDTLAERAVPERCLVVRWGAHGCSCRNCLWNIYKCGLPSRLPRSVDHHQRRSLRDLPHDAHR
jgi:hypothetical protein